MMLTGSGVERNSVKVVVALFLSFMADTSRKAMSENTHWPAVVCASTEITNRN